MSADPALQTRLAGLIRDVPDFPEPGVLFKDITPLLADDEGLRLVTDAFAATYSEAGVDKIVGMEARGFIFAAPLAVALGCGFVPVRKPGKLPSRTRTISYDLEYGSESLELHVDAIEPGERVLLVDDVLATGGTARATADLVADARGEVVALAVLMELSFLPGRTALGDVPVTALLTV